MKVLILCGLFVVVSISNALSQHINEIRFQGLNKTRLSYIAQFVTLKKGDELDSIKLEKSIQQLLNLEIINEVNSEVTVIDGSVTIIINCKESGTLLPIFHFGSVKDNFWFRVGGSEINFLGKGHKLHAYYQYNRLHSLLIGYAIPRMFQSSWDINMSLVNWSSIEPLYFQEGTSFYNYNNKTIGLAISYNFNYVQRLTIGASFFNERYKKDDKMPFGPDNVIKEKWLGKLIYYVNHQNYHYYMVNGWSNTLNMETVVTNGEQVPFYIFFNDLKYFRQYGKKYNLAARVRVGLSTNNESPFAPFVLDSYVNIRGAGNKVDRGTGTITFNIENRFTGIDRIKVAAQAVLFTDIGSWRLPSGGFDDFVNVDVFRVFSGIGVRAIYKKNFNAIFRIDYGVDLLDTQQHGLVIGVGQYF